MFIVGLRSQTWGVIVAWCMLVISLSPFTDVGLRSWDLPQVLRSMILNWVPWLQGCVKTQNCKTAGSVQEEGLSL